MLEAIMRLNSAKLIKLISESKDTNRYALCG